MPTIGYGFHKQHAEVRLDSLEFHSKEIKRIHNYCRINAKGVQPLRDQRVPTIGHLTNEKIVNFFLYGNFLI